jgi:hypothetical protein
MKGTERNLPISVNWLDAVEEVRDFRLERTVETLRSIIVIVICPWSPFKLIRSRFLQSPESLAECSELSQYMNWCCGVITKDDVAPIHHLIAGRRHTFDYHNRNGFA